MAQRINYGKLMHKALRHLMAEVLTQVSQDGLPGQHHFFITFDTRHPGVDMAPSLAKRYPGEMTIVLQDWFSDLAVMPDRFTVTLNFGNIPEPIVVPFEAIKTFVDPSVEFGLRFDAQEEGGADAHHMLDGTDGETDDDDTEAKPAGDGDGEVVSLDKFRKH